MVSISFPRWLPVVCALLCAARSTLQVAAGEWSGVRIEPHYDASFAALSSQDQKIVKDVLVEPVLQWVSAALQVRPRTAAIKFPRACKSDGFSYLINDNRYCSDECADETMCGPFPVLSSHLTDCRKCAVNSRRLVCDGVESSGASGQEEVEGGISDLLVYVGAVEEDACLRGYGTVHTGHCLQEPEYDRPTVIFLNFCPGAISASISHHTVLHELLHALAFSEELLPYFHDRDGNPRSRRSRHGQPLRNPDGSYRVDSTTVRDMRLSQWSTYSGPLTHSIRMIVTPKVVEEVRAHFNCSSLLGAELEDLATGGTALHWEKRVFGDELMTASPSARPVLSRISLALLEDTGWYTVTDYTFAGKFMWGRSKGCAFVNDSCGGWLDWNRQHAGNAAPFCNGSTQSFGCVDQRTGLGPCAVARFNYPLPPSYQYLSPPLGGVQALADYCPVFRALHYSTHSIGRSCLDPSHAPVINVAGESYGSDSRCFEHYSAFVVTNETSHEETPIGDGVGCYQFQCTRRRVLITVGGVRVRCLASSEGQRKSVEFNQSGVQHTGAIVCPSYQELCSVSVIVEGLCAVQCITYCFHPKDYNCLHMCSAHGSCGTDGRCVCHVGYFGEDCSRNAHEQLMSCQNITCANNATCTDSPLGGFECSCPSGFTGALCESELVPDPCAGVDCSGNGKCHILDQGTRQECVCDPPFIGRRCQEQTDLCAYNGHPCLNGGACASGACDCHGTGYWGPQCEHVDYCALNPCLNGGTCMDTGNQSRHCICTPEFEGDDCSTLIVDPCNNQSCLNGGNCSRLNNTHSLCQCDQLYVGERCESYNYCADSPCLNGATCQNGDDTFSCICARGYKGLRCRKRSNPCRPTPCFNDGQCSKAAEYPNGTITVECSCSPGFSGEFCQHVV